MDGKLCPGIQPPLSPLEISTPSFRESPLFNPEIFQLPPPFLKFWLESQRPLKGGGGVPTMKGTRIFQ